MVYGVTALLAFSSATRRDSVRDAITTRIVGRPRWSVDEIEAAANRIGPNGLRVCLRFVSRADADDLKARVESFSTGQRTPLAGSWLLVHDCTHDEGTNECTVVASRTW